MSISTSELRAHLEALAREADSYAEEARAMATKLEADWQEALMLADRAENEAKKARRAANGG